MSLADTFSAKRKAARRVVEAVVREGLVPLEDVAFRAQTRLEHELEEDVLVSMVRDCWKHMAHKPLPQPTSLERLQTYTGYCFYDHHLAETMPQGTLALCFGLAKTPITDIRCNRGLGASSTQ